jgi:hypothetical protein
MANKFGDEPIKKLSPFGDEPVDEVGAPEQQTTLREFVEPMATIATGAIAEPIAGLAGIAQSINPFAEEGAGARAVESTREALTYMPETEGGQQVLGDVGTVLEPAAKALEWVEEGFGDTVFEKTGSPTLAAAAATIPTAVMEVTGIAAGKGALKKTRDIKERFKQGKIYREMDEAAPSIDQLKSTSNSLYREIDDMGASVAQKSYDFLSRKIKNMIRKEGGMEGLTDKAITAVKRFETFEGGDVKLTDLESLRKIAQNVADSIDPSEKRLGVLMINTVDDFLDTLGPKGFKRPQGVDPQDISKKYRAARDMWGRARRSEMLQEAFEKARNQASGFENGIRTQLRSILNNKRKSKFFTTTELDAMRKVVRGGEGFSKENMARLIGKLGFSEGSATSFIGGSIGVGGGYAAGGVPGAVVVPMIGQVSKKLAQRMTAKGAEFADMIIRAGKNGPKIVEAYLKNTPKAKRSSQELSELLTRGDIDLDSLPDTPLMSEAKKLAMDRRAQLAGLTAASAIAGEKNRTEREQ